MVFRNKWRIFFALLAAALLIIVLGYSQEDTQNVKIQSLANWIRERGFHCTLLPLTDARMDVDIKFPVIDDNAWYLMQVNGEDLFVYFDTSNRAKQLAEQFFYNSDFERTVAFRMRFIISYNGANGKIHGLLDELQKA